MSEVAERFGENLRYFRKARGMSQEELGLRCSLHRTEIGLLERGARVPRVDTLIKLASGLGIRVDCALLGGIRWTPATTQAGGFTIKSRIEVQREAMQDLAEVRAGQSGTFDAVAEIHKSRRELDER